MAKPQPPVLQDPTKPLSTSKRVISFFKHSKNVSKKEWSKAIIKSIIANPLFVRSLEVVLYSEAINLTIMLWTHNHSFVQYLGSMGVYFCVQELFDKIGKTLKR